MLISRGSRAIAVRTLLCVVAVFVLGPIDARSADAPRPNIVLVMLDDLGFSDLGCYGSEIETPHIDRLASGGLRFTQFYNTAKCHSSRICLLTGLYTGQAGEAKMDRAVTIAELLKPAGYFTAMTGKWHLADEPTDRGFQRYFGHLSGATDFFKGDNTFRLNGKQWSDFGEDFYTTDANTDYAIRFIDEAVDTDKPFFMYIAHNAPHYPLQAPKSDIAKYIGRYKIGWDALRARRFAKQKELGIIGKQAKLSERPAYIPQWDKLTEKQKTWEDLRMATFAAVVDRVDQNMGRLVAHLKARGVYKNTIILLCADNGACPFDRTHSMKRRPWEAGTHLCYDVGWAHAGNTPFRWYKQNQHEGGISGPLIVHWPGGLKTADGAITHQPGHLIDLLPTLGDLAGAKYPEIFDGRKITSVQGKSLTPIFAGKQRQPHEWLYFQFSTDRAIRMGDWKLVSAKGGPWELYNIAIDRTELIDHAQHHSARVKAMAAKWHDVAERIDHRPANHRKPVKDKPTPLPYKRAKDKLPPIPDDLDQIIRELQSE